MDKLPSTSNPKKIPECKVYTVSHTVEPGTAPKSSLCGAEHGGKPPVIILSREDTCLLDKKGAPTKEAIKDIESILGEDSAKYFQEGRAFHFHVSGANLRNFTGYYDPKK